MRTWIPWKEIRDDMMKEPGFAEGVRVAGIELEAELAAERAERTQFFAPIAKPSFAAAKPKASNPVVA